MLERLYIRHYKIPTHVVQCTFGLTRGVGGSWSGDGCNGLKRLDGKCRGAEGGFVALDRCSSEGWCAQRGPIDYDVDFVIRL